MSISSAGHKLSEAPQTAKAVRLVGAFAIDALSFDTIPIVRPGRGQVLVKMKAVSLNYRDLMIVKGTYAPDLAKPRITRSFSDGLMVGFTPSIKTRLSVVRL